MTTSTVSTTTIVDANPDERLEEALLFIAAALAPGVKVGISKEKKEILFGREEYLKALASGPPEIEVVLCDPDDPGVRELVERARKNKEEDYNIAYEKMDVSKLPRHPVHGEIFKESHKDLDPSYFLKGRIKPYFTISFSYGNKRYQYLIDGGKFAAMNPNGNRGESDIAVVGVATLEELKEVMTNLQSSFNMKARQQYIMAEALYKQYGKGRGFRSDLEEEEEGLGPNERRPTIYDRIARQMFVSSNTVKYLLKVGRVHPENLDDIDSKRKSLYAAYLEAGSNEQSRKLKSPKVQEIVYVTGMTQPPVPGQTSTTWSNPESGNDDEPDDFEPDDFKDDDEGDVGEEDDEDHRHQEKQHQEEKSAPGSGERTRATLRDCGAGCTLLGMTAGDDKPIEASMAYIGKEGNNFLLRVTITSTQRSFALSLQQIEALDTFNKIKE